MQAIAHSLFNCGVGVASKIVNESVIKKHDRPVFWLQKGKSIVIEAKSGIEREVLLRLIARRGDGLGIELWALEGPGSAERLVAGKSLFC